jgi:hypothetical protein
MTFDEILAQILDLLQRVLWSQGAASARLLRLPAVIRECARGSMLSSGDRTM